MKIVVITKKWNINIIKIQFKQIRLVYKMIILVIILIVIQKVLILKLNDKFDYFNNYYLLLEYIYKKKYKSKKLKF
jgi:hypothetical protein